VVPDDHTRLVKLTVKSGVDAKSYTEVCVRVWVCGCVRVCPLCPSSLPFVPPSHVRSWPRRRS
jgi:hypothetical protein